MKYWPLYSLLCVMLFNCDSKEETSEDNYVPIPYQLEIPVLFQTKLNRSNNPIKQYINC